MGNLGKEIGGISSVERRTLAYSSAVCSAAESSIHSSSEDFLIPRDDIRGSRRMMTSLFAPPRESQELHDSRQPPHPAPRFQAPHSPPGRGHIGLCPPIVERGPSTGTTSDHCGGLQAGLARDDANVGCFTPGSRHRQRRIRRAGGPNRLPLLLGHRSHGAQASRGLGRPSRGYLRGGAEGRSPSTGAWRHTDHPPG